MLVRVQVFGEEMEKQADGKSFKKLILGDYKWITYREVDRKLDLIGKALMSLGVRPRQNVVVLAETRMEWMLTAQVIHLFPICFYPHSIHLQSSIDLHPSLFGANEYPLEEKENTSTCTTNCVRFQACLRLNIPVVTLFATLGEDGIIHGVNETEATHLITSLDLLPKVVKILPQMSSLTHIVYMENPVMKTKPTVPPGINMLPFSQLESIGASADKELRGEVPAPDDTAIIMYTSGSTGVPKGVMITQSNIVATARGFATIVPEVLDDNDAYIAYLPLAHVLELAAEHLSLALGCKIGYSSPLTLTDKSTGIKSGQKGDAALLRPTIMVSVPLVLDRVRKAITEVADSKGPFSKMFFRHVVAYKNFWVRLGYRTPIVDRLVFNKVAALLGGRMRVIATGSAPLSGDTHDFVRNALDCAVVQGYGLTETAAGGAIMEVCDQSCGKVGAPLVGAAVKLADWDEAGYHALDNPPRGEIVIGGDTVAKGYYKNDSLTREMFFEENGMRWFYTGDIGEMCSDGTIKIIDRKKDLVKLQYGEYVSLGKIETELKTCPIVDNICVYGSSFHTYLVALVVPNRKVILQLAEQLGKSTKDSQDNFAALCEDNDIVREATAIIVVHAREAQLIKMEIPTKVKLCHEDWLPQNGLVTAAFKIRRKQIQDFYQEAIDSLYSKRHANSKST